MSKYCPHCSAEQKNHAIFCSVCGKPLPVGTELGRAPKEKNAVPIEADSSRSFQQIMSSATVQTIPSDIPSKKRTTIRTWLIVFGCIIVGCIAIFAIASYCANNYIDPFPEQISIEKVLLFDETYTVQEFESTYGIRPDFADSYETVYYIKTKLLRKTCNVRVSFTSEGNFACANFSFVPFFNEAYFDGDVFFEPAAEYLSKTLGSYSIIDNTPEDYPQKDRSVTWAHPTSKNKSAHITIAQNEMDAFSFINEVVAMGEPDYDAIPWPPASEQPLFDNLDALLLLDESYTVDNVVETFQMDSEYYVVYRDTLIYNTYVFGQPVYFYFTFEDDYFSDLSSHSKPSPYATLKQSFSNISSHLSKYIGSPEYEKHVYENEEQDDILELYTYNYISSSGTAYEISLEFSYALQDDQSYFSLFYTPLP